MADINVYLFDDTEYRSDSNVCFYFCLKEHAWIVSN